MKEFSDLEKQILKKLVGIQERIKTETLDEYDGIEVLKVIQPFLNERNMAMKVDFVKQSIMALCNANEKDFDVLEKCFGMVITLHAVSLLIDYLAQNNLLYIVHKRKVLGTLNVNKLELPDEAIAIYSQWPGLNEKLTKDLISKFESTYLLSQDIIAHVKNNFKTKEDIFRERSLHLADRNGQIALLTAILSLLVSILLAMVQIVFN